MATLRINNNDFNVIDINPTASQTIVMIHGIFTNMSVYYFTIAQELAKEYRVILYDLKGHGLSETAPSGYDLQSMSDDLLGILDGLGLNKVHLAGYSFGGLIAMYTAMYHSNIVDKLIVIESADFNDGESRPLLEKYDKEYLDQYVDYLAKSTNMAPSKRKIDKIHRQVQFLFENTSIKNDFYRYKDLFARLSEKPIVQETLLLYATHSECTKTGKILRNQIKKSTLYYGKGDHNLPVQNPDWIIEKISNFLKPKPIFKRIWLFARKVGT